MQARGGSLTELNPCNSSANRTEFMPNSED